PAAGRPPRGAPGDDARRALCAAHLPRDGRAGRVETDLRQRHRPPMIRHMTPARYLDRHHADLVAFLQRIIRLRTVNPPGENYGEITALLARTLRDLGMKVRRLPVPRAQQR